MGFFDHEDVGCEMMRRYGCGHAGRAGANDQHVAGDGFHPVSRLLQGAISKAQFPSLRRSLHPRADRE